VLVEFAVVLPVLLLLILGIISFGRFFNYADQESQLSAQAARWAAVDFNPPGTQTLQSYVGAQAMGGLQTASGDVTKAAQVYIYYPTGSSNAVGNPVRACVVSTVQLLPMLGGTALQVTESATMRIEQSASNWATTDNVGTMPSSCPTS
jgi:Flp pilus assembly protein TadG